MTLGHLVRRAMERKGITQVELSRLSGVDKYSIGDIVNDRRDPQFDTLRKLVDAMTMSWTEFFDEPRLVFSSEEVRAVRSARDTMDRLLANDAALKAARPTRPLDPGRSARRVPSGSEIRDSSAMDEVQPSDEPIPEWHYRQGVRRAFTVTTDAMIGPGAGILAGATIFVRPTLDAGAADGEIVVCKLNGTHYLKRLDRRGGETALESTKSGYPRLVVTEKDTFSLVGVVVLQPAE